MREHILNKLKENGIIIKECILIDDNELTVTSRVDGSQRKRIYGAYLKSIGITSDEYKILFPDAPLYSKNDNANTTINSGKHMKQEKYKKMFSEKIKGDKNPSHKSKTTEQQRKERSPFSAEFYKKKDPTLTDEMIDQKRFSFAKDAMKNRIGNTQIEYYTNMGYDIETAKHMLSERQRTFSLHKCIENHGEIKGRERWNERQFKWNKSLSENGNIRGGFSTISQEMFDNILEYYSFNDKEFVFYASKNNEVTLTDGTNTYRYDFTDEKNKKIIEFNGDIYHANPNIYESHDKPHPFRKNITARELWENDYTKKVVAEGECFEILYVWELDYKTDKSYQLQRCVDFLFGKNNKNIC